MSDVRQWVAVNDGVVVHSGMGATKEFVDAFDERVVQPEHLTTPPWYIAGTTKFVDVTGLSTPPGEGWKKSKNKWVAPTLTPEQQAVLDAEKADREAAEALDARRAIDDGFVADMRTKIEAGDALTDVERDRLAVIQAERGALVPPPA